MIIRKRDGGSTRGAGEQADRRPWCGKRQPRHGAGGMGLSRLPGSPLPPHKEAEGVTVWFSRVMTNYQVSGFVTRGHPLPILEARHLKPRCRLGQASFERLGRALPAFSSSRAPGLLGLWPHPSKLCLHCHMVSASHLLSSYRDTCHKT